MIVGITIFNIYKKEKAVEGLKKSFFLLHRKNNKTGNIITIKEISLMSNQNFLHTILLTMPT